MGNMTAECSARGRWISLMAVMALALGVVTGFAEGDWRVAEAPIRFTVELSRPPSHASAGYFFTIPDGGILPQPFPLVQVFDESGNQLKSAILWQCNNTGVGVVVAASSGRTLTAYVSGSQKLSLWSPDSGLTPSAMICTYPGHGTRADAVKLSQFGQVDATVHYRNQSGSQMAALALPGDRSGRPGACAMYMLAYVATTDPGNTWIAPVAFSGQMEVVIDGRPVRPAKKNGKQGGTGESVPLSSGLHRMDIFGYNSAGGATGPLLMTWRTPSTSPGELGGVRPSDLPDPGTPMWEARQLRDNEIVRSGEGVIRDAQMKDGGPVAMFSLRPENIYWFEGENGLLHYRLRATTGTNPKDTKYSWMFSGDPGAVASGRDLDWLFLGSRTHWVTLKAEAGDKQSKCAIPFYPFTDVGSSLNNPNTRIAFREACLSVLKAYPPEADLAAKWDVTYWDNLFRSLELVPEDPLIQYIVTARWDMFRKALPVERRELIEDLFLLETGWRDPKMAFKWAGVFAATTKSKPRATIMTVRQAEIMMYYMKDFAGAEKILRPLLIEPGEAGEWAQIRMGDMEFLKKNLNEATQRYGDVQNRSKHGKTPEAEGVRRLKGAAMGGPVKVADARKKKIEAAVPKKPSTDLDPAPTVAAWKLSAIRDVAASEDVRNLMEQGFYLEAWQALKRWEREFPLSKVSSDYILQEGKMLIQLGDYARARTILSAYCDQVDASNFVPEALRLVVRCMIEMREPEAEITKYEKEISKRMEFRTEQE